MGYRLRRSERVEEGARRIVRAQLSGAVDATRPPEGRARSQEDRVHEVRTRLKRARAALKLFGGEARAVVKRDDRRLRDVARLLAKARDLAVQEQTFHAVGASLPDELSDRSRPDKVERKLRQAGRKLRKLRRTVGVVRVEHGGRTVTNGIIETYRQARRAMTAVRERPTAKRFHDWRKRVKALWFQLLIIRPVVPQLAATLTPTVAELAEVLGSMNDLDGAKSAAERHPTWFGPRDSGEAVVSLVDRRRAQLEKEAFALAETAFAERPRELRVHVETGWQAWRKGRGKQPVRTNATLDPAV